MSEDIGTSSCSTSPDDGGGGVGPTVVGGTPGSSSAGGRGSASLQEESSDQPPREPTPASFSASSRDYSSGRDGGNTTTTGTPGTASSSGRHSSLSHGGRSSSHLALAHTPPLEAPSLPHRPDTPLSATAPQTSYLAHTPPNEGSRSPFSLAGLHAALPSSSSALGGGIIHPQPMGVAPSLGSSSTSLTMIGNPLHNPGASYSRYSSGVVTPHESVGYEASNEPSLYSGGGSYGYSRIDSKLHGDDFDYMDDDPGIPRPGSGGVVLNSGSYPGLYGGRGPVPSSLLYRSESISSATDSPSNQPEQGIYEDDSIFDQPPPPPAPAPTSSKHGRDKTAGSASKKNKFFKNYYDKASLNQLISSSAKVSNRDISVNRMCGGYGSDGDPTYAGAGLTEMLEDPVEEEGGERVVWEYHNVTLTRVPGYGFGIAVSGGRDNPHFRNGDPSIAISDVLKAGPAEGKLEVNDRLISANGVSLEGVEYARAVQVLRDSGASVQLMVRRRVVLPSASPQTLTVTLTRTRRKEEYGVVLGCRLYIKEVVRGGLAARNGGLREGDELLRINTSPTDDLSLKEARKMLESQKEQLQLVVRRHAQPSPSTLKELCDPGGGGGVGGYAAQNLYVQPPSRPSEPHGGGHYPPGTMLHHDKNNLNRYPGGSSDFPYGSVGDGGGVSSPTDSGAAALPPRPPLPRPEDYYAPPPQTHGGPRAPASPDPQDGTAGVSPTKSQGPVPEPRFVSFRKEGSAGIRLTGGNEVGIFVTAVQAASQAQLQGIVPGDKVLKVNEMELSGVTREEAVLYLMSLQEQIELIVQTRLHDYQQILASQKGDLFYIKTHFHYEPEGTGELSFRSGDVFRVVDTLHGGVVGAWQVERIGRNNQETQRGTIPNKSRAEELATAQFNQAKKEQTQSESRSGFFRRRRNSRRSKSLGKDHWEDVVFGDSMSKFPAYERVSLQHPGFVRPVVLFGPLADVARTKLLGDNPDHFSSPQLDSQGEKQQASIIRLSAIREIVERGKHALLDITPSAVDRLNYAQFCPIVIYLRVDSKQAVKEMRAGFPNLLCSRGRQSSKKLFEQSLKVERLWGHVFTSTLTLTQPDTWPRKLVQAIAQHQAQPVWMAQNKPSEALSDDFLFPMTSRLSYASSPESDMEGGSDPHTPSRTPHRLSSPSSPHTQTSQAGGHSPTNGAGPLYPSSSQSRSRMVKSSSDPSIAAPEDLQSGGSGGYYGPNMGGAPPPYSASPPRMPRPADPTPATDDRRKSHGGDSKYGFGGTTSDGYSGGQRGGNNGVPPPSQQQQHASNSPYAVPPPNGGAPSSSSHGGSPPSSITYGYGSQQPSSMNSVASSNANALMHSPHRPQPPPNNNNGQSPPNGAGPHHPHFNHHSRLPPPPPNNQTNANNNPNINGNSSNLNNNNSNVIPAATSTPSTNNNPRFPHSPQPPHINNTNNINNNNNNHNSNNANSPSSGHPSLPSLPPPNHTSNLPPGYPPSKPSHLAVNGHGPKPGPLNGHKSPPKDVVSPPRIDRSNKPGKPREFAGAEYDANYINTGRGGPLDQHRKVGYGEPGIGPNAHDDLKSRYHHQPQHPYGGGQFPPPPLPGGHPVPQHPGSHHHHRSAEAHSQRYPRSASQPPAFHGEDPYGMKPAPPPKGGPHKPVPPPKPRQYRGAGGWPTEKPSRGAGSTSAPNGRLSDDYSAIDSGHGSSLERKCDTFGRGGYPKQSSGSQGYYLNVPMPRGAADNGGGGGGGGGGGSRADLPNHDHRGSAFELYKKPADPRARPPPQQQQQFYAGEPQGNR